MNTAKVVATYAAADPDKGAMVGCSCGWRLWLGDVPKGVEDRLSWLLDRKDEHECEAGK